MIASLRGEIVDLGANYCVVECGGVGHLVTITGATAAVLTRNEETFLLTTLVVREDAMTLFGFQNRVEREMFDVLRAVSGVGPKVAMSILSILGPADIARAVATKNAKALQAANGVGKRMADRLIVELKDKVGAFEEFGSAEDTQANLPRGEKVVMSADLDQVIGALTGLGFPDAEAKEAAEGVVAAEPTLDTSAALRAALKVLGR